MSDKASVSKELNAQHAKILLGLLKLPENKECADCKNKGPRWASINLGIFICMRCSGIHRSLGVHISKVRSTTLDIWLPDQVAFMQAMGNQKANSYWEADLPLEFYRSPIETFIYAKYVDRRWASTTSPQPNPDEISSISVRKEIPKKARRYSLDEEFFIKPLIAPPTSTHHSRAESLSLMDGLDDSAPPPLISFEKGLSSSSSSSKTTNMDNSAAAAAAAAAGGTSTGTGTDLFSLLYVSQETQDRTVVPPSRWATFDD